MIPYHRHHTSYNLWWVEGATEKQGKDAPPPWVRPYAQVQITTHIAKWIWPKMEKRARNGISASKNGKMEKGERNGHF